MKQIKQIYNRSMVDKSKRRIGYLLNAQVNEAFKMLCKLKDVNYSDKVENMMRAEIEEYLEEYEEG